MDSLESHLIYFNRGHLDLSGQKASFAAFYCLADDTLSGFSGRSPLRTIDFHNAEIDSKRRWEYIGGQQITPLQSANSLIKVTYFSTDYASADFISKGNDYYHNVEHSLSLSLPTRNYCINDTAYFNKITYNGYPGGTFTLNNGGGTIYPDSLVFATKGTYVISDTLPVRKYLSTPVLNPCESKAVMTIYYLSLSAVIQMDTVNPVLTDRVQVRNADITNVSITNGPYDVQYCDTFGTATGWNNTINTNSYTGRYYWVGGTGNWHDPMHWANTSGGTPGSAGCVPTAQNTVVFDNNSFSARYQRVSASGSGNPPAVCDSMLWIGHDTLCPQFWAGSPTVSGSLVLQKNMAWTSSNTLYLNSSRPNETVKTNGQNQSTWIPGLIFNGTGGWTLLDSLTINGSILFLSTGRLDFNGQYVSAGSFSGGTGTIGYRSFLNIKHSEIRVGSWSYVGDLTADSSYIYCGTMSAEQTSQYIAQYHNVELSSSITNGKYHKVDVISAANIRSIETDTLILANNSNHTYTFRDTTRVKEAYYGAGTPCYLIYLQSYDKTTPAIFDIKTACANLPNDTLLIDNVYLHGIKALTGVGNAKLKKGAHSPDINEIGAMWGYGIGTNHYNQDWAAMLPYNAGGSSYFGGNRIVCQTELPVTLSSDNFLPSLGAAFYWRKDSIKAAVSSFAPTYNVNDSGTYYLTIDYGNSCMISDSIHFSISNVDTTKINAAICAGTYYSQNGFNENQEGTYYRTAQSIYHCDSVIELTLTFSDLLTDTLYQAICQGGTYNLNGFNENQAGTYQHQTQTAEGCDSLTVLILTINELLTDTIYANICQGGIYYYNGQPITPTDSFSTFNFQFSTPEGCDSLTVLVLTVNELLTDTIYDQICQGGTYYYNGQPITPTDSFSTFNFQFSTPEGCDSLVILHLTLIPPDTIRYYDTICPNYPYTNHGFNIPASDLQTSGNYDFMDSIADAAGCETMVILHLTVRDLLPLAVNLGNDTTICWLDSLLLNAKHANATHYQWQDGSTGVTYTVYYDGEYWVIITNPCSAASDTINISYLKELELNLGKDTVFCEEDIIDIQLDITSPYASYLWQDGSTSPIYSIKEAGMYSVTVSNACMSISDAIEISTRDCNCKMLLPNIFTPQNGRYVYLPEVSQELNSFSMIIYDRWGYVVYKTNTYTAWNGKIHNNGKDVSAGVYFCVVEYTCKDTLDKKQTAQGSVTVVR